MSGHTNWLVEVSNMLQRPSVLEPTGISLDILIEDITCTLVGNICDPYRSEWHGSFLQVVIKMLPERLKQFLLGLAASRV